MMMLFLPLIIMAGGANWYLARRLITGLRVFFPNLGKWAFWTLFSVMLLLLVAGFLSVPVLGTVGTWWMGIFVYLFLAFLVCDGLGLVLRLFKRRWKYLPLAAVVLGLSVSVYGFVHGAQLQTARYSVNIDGLQGNMKVVLLTDLHLGASRTEARLGDLVEKVNAEQPDLICISGDLFNSDFGAMEDPAAVAATLGRLEATYGVYACWGNHDAGSTYAQMEAFLPACGITLLKEEGTVIDGRLYLVGRLDGTPIGSNGGQSRRQISEILADAPDLPVLVMDHNPSNLSEYGEETDLVLSGHTHKGQIFPGSLITDAMYTVDYGYYRGDTQIIVSSGAFYWGMPMRVGSDCEIVSIDLVAP